MWNAVKRKKDAKRKRKECNADEHQRRKNKEAKKPKEPKETKTSSNVVLETWTRVDLSHRNCWLLVSKCLPPEICMSNAIFKEIWNLRPSDPGKVKIFGKVVDVPRHQASFGQSYFFSGIHHQALPLTHPFLKAVLNYCRQHSGLPYEQILVNWYENGTKYIGWHSDDESELVTWPFLGAGIYSFSYGADRFFQLRTRENNASKTTVRLTVTNNSGVIMCGNTQKQFKHRIPKQLRVLAPRLNITVRLFKVSYIGWELQKVGFPKELAQIVVQFVHTKRF